MPVELIICGAAGRMGRTLTRLASVDPDLRVRAAVEAPGVPSVGQDAGDLSGVGRIGVEIRPDYDPSAWPEAITLDFTQAAASVEHLRIAAARQTPIVIGSTGFDAAQRAEIDQLAPRTRCVIAANMSVGVNVLLTLVQAAAKALGDDFDPEIVEIHHRLKVDAPSGTALALARAAGEALGRNLDEDGVYGRHGVVGQRKHEEIGVMALRGGDAVGDHTVMFVGMGERLELTHRAQSRDCLAGGALRAAKWLAQRTRPGRYSMANVLGIVTS